jgi:hypothetical protein
MLEGRRGIGDRLLALGHAGVADAERSGTPPTWPGRG